MNKEEIKEIVYETIREVAYEYFDCKAKNEKALMNVALIMAPTRNKPESASGTVHNGYFPPIY